MHHLLSNTDCAVCQRRSSGVAARISHFESGRAWNLPTPSFKDFGWGMMRGVLVAGGVSGVAEGREGS
jgi:hypothetical protein